MAHWPYSQAHSGTFKSTKNIFWRKNINLSKQKSILCVLNLCLHTDRHLHILSQCLSGSLNISGNPASLVKCKIKSYFQHKIMKQLAVKLTSTNLSKSHSVIHLNTLLPENFAIWKVNSYKYVCNEVRLKKKCPKFSRFFYRELALRQTCIPY